MDLHTYLSQGDAPTATDLAKRLNINPDQLRQWRHKYSGRRPSPESCVLIEQITGGQVTRQDLRPDDWHRIWPELVQPKRRKPSASAQEA